MFHQLAKSVLASGADAHAVYHLYKTWQTCSKVAEHVNVWTAKTDALQIAKELPYFTKVLDVVHLYCGNLPLLMTGFSRGHSQLAA